MYKKIKSEDLRVGMYVVDVGLSWLENPYLFMSEGVLEDEASIEAVLADGFEEAIIDVRRSRKGSVPDDLVPLEDMSTAEQVSQAISNTEEVSYKSSAPPPSVTVSAEMSKAQAIYSESLSFVRGFMDSAREGKPVDMESAEPLVEDIIQSVSRNAGALIGFAKLRAYDHYTYTHCLNVSLLAVAFAKYLGLETVALRQIGLAGLFHDLGKAMIPDFILNCPGRLTPEEFTVMKRHPVLGKDVLPQNGKLPEMVLQGMMEHHEKYNGAGYPKGLKGDEISQAGRILSVVDVYDALTSKRPYKNAMMPNKALSILYSMAGEDFYPGYVEHFIKCLGIYPVGQVVQLNTGQVGVVAATDPAQPLRPVVIIVRDPLGRPASPRLVDLAQVGSVTITATVLPVQAGIDPVRVLEDGPST
ncbi:HD-GYP domain-containing protein [Oleidesulfovibrio sp.]|uniref:HD-GYP domain-containing protein n=1 Tax=Oleidesulfovibrio sp. TaxID=2909707 RepID=UPI003A8810ED